MRATEIQAAIDRCPRRRLLHLPTPLQPLDHLRETVGGPLIWVKRDDLTGLAFGGNKSRYLEFTLAEAMEQGADAVVLSAVVHSNHCRQFAAAAAHLGLQAVVVLRENDTAMGRTDPVTGNHLLDRLFGARVRIAPPSDVRAAIDEEMERLRHEGRQPFTGVSAVLSRIAYVQCALELDAQCDAAGIDPATVFIGSGSNSIAGLVAGFALLGRRTRFIGTPQGHVSDAEAASRRVVDAAIEAIERLGLESAPPATDDVRVDDRFVGPGFGHLDDATRETIGLLARTEGLLVDPAYTGKAFHGLLCELRAGRWPDDADVVFVHTGGTPLVFTYGEDLFS
jgi:1-aminocyclopropane-1-carboxylate deaminase/D-cysteine desulfhydrase-like pyridoxal-dependent ACC family enzyme